MTNISQNPQLCKVFYDRSARAYIVRNGREIARFPSGPANRAKAQWAAVQHDAPAVAEIARMLIEDGADEGRALRAARIAIEGDRIFTHERKDNYTFAKIQASDGNRSPRTGWDFYQVYHNIKWQCDCYDCERGRDDDPHFACKHILAIQIIERLADTEQADFEAAAQRKMADKTERAAQRPQTVAQQIAEVRATLPGADHLNRKGRHYRNFNDRARRG